MGSLYWRGLVLLCTLTLAVCYKPVIVMHGIASSSATMKGMVDMIKKAHPGTEVYNVDAYNDAETFTVTIDEQVNGVYNKIKPIIDKSEDGVIMLGFSQGGLVLRGVLERYPINVHTFISLSSPQGGQYGDTSYFKDFLPNYTKEHLYQFFYSVEGQKISIGNYWNDPCHQPLYHKWCTFLPAFNNGSISGSKSNFLTLQQLVLIGGPDDGVITPWQSSHFASYQSGDCSGTQLPIPFKSLELYQKDYFGLQTLDAAGKVMIYEVPGVEHVKWHSNQTVFDNNIEPWLI